MVEVMNAVILVTFSGKDRPGLVDELSETIARFEGNWEQSRMMHLADRFIGLLEVQVDATRVATLESALRGIPDLEMTIARGEATPPAGQLFQIEIMGADHPGIVREVFGVIAQAGLNVESLSSRTEAAPDSGMPIFRARAMLGSSSSVDLTVLQQSLESIAADIQVSVTLSQM